MGVYEYEQYDPHNGYYNMRNKLWDYVMKRTENCFVKAENKRNSILTKEDFLQYQDEMRNVFIDSIGGIPYDADLPLHAETVGVIEEETLTIEKVIFQSRLNVYVTANLYIPKNIKKPCGGVLFQIGHAQDGKFCARYQCVARAIASAGLVVLIFDPTGQGERQNYCEKDIDGAFMVPPAVKDHGYCGNGSMLLGQSLIRYFISDAMRAVDYLVSRTEVDADKIGATGSSGGGTMTSVMMLCDKRIKAAAPGTFITTRKEYYHAGGAQDAEQIWFGTTALGFDHYELVGCFAPKPVLLLTVDTDFFPIEGAEDVLAQSKRFWSLFGEKEKISAVRDASKHQYTDVLAKAAANFFSKYLNGENCEADMQYVKAIDPKSLQCTKTGQVVTSFSNAMTIFDEDQQNWKMREKMSGIKEFIEQAMLFERKPEPLHIRRISEWREYGLYIHRYMWFSQRQMPCYGILFSDYKEVAKETVICLWDKGTNDIESYIYKIREICAQGKNAFILDMSGMGKSTPDSIDSSQPEKAHYGTMDRIAKDLFFLGDSLCGLRLYDLKRAIEAIKTEIGGEVSLFATGVCAAYARLWKIMEPDTEIELCMPMPDYLELFKQKYYENYNITGVILPGIMRYIGQEGADV